MSFPHIDVMVIMMHIDKWDVSQAEILFLSALDQMGYNSKQLKEGMKPLDGFGGKRIKLVGSISLPISFESLRNART
jgi:hypothetical protein